MTLRPLLWLASTLLGLLALPLLLALALALFGWNWARAPLQDLALRKTGRELRIAGDLSVAFAWPVARIRAQGVSFANPPWATQTQMISVEAMTVGLDLRELLKGRLQAPEVRLSKPRIFLEQASGNRKTWLLDRNQTDEQMRIPIGHLLLDDGALTYVDPVRHTAIYAELSTSSQGDVSFSAAGQLLGLPLLVSGSGGGVLALRDELTPYPIRFEGTLGHTGVQAQGSVTSLFRLSAMDLQLALRGDNLAALVPVLGIPLPPTPPYRAAGHLVHSGKLWRYEAFTGQVGRSDMAGSIQFETGGARPLLTGALVSRRLALADLGPAVGATLPVAATVRAGPPHVLPELPFDTRYWASVDADVTLKAQTLLRTSTQRLENLQLRLRLQDARLSLDPLSFALAGGQLLARITIDGRTSPLRGSANLQLNDVLLGRLLPTVDLRRNSIGLLTGRAELAGQGPSVSAMLASADGRLSLVAQRGQISRLLMEQTGLHLLEILKLSLGGDESIRMNCAVADFELRQGQMQARTLVLDSAVTTLTGSGHVDLAHERLDLTLVPHTKVSSLVALRSPLHLRGSFSQPELTVDSGAVAARGAGALALGLLNPLLALVPLFEGGPGVASDCSALVSATRKALPKAAPAGPQR